jgi:hypothetical protein
VAEVADLSRRFQQLKMLITGGRVMMIIIIIIMIMGMGMSIST